MTRLQYIEEKSRIQGLKHQIKCQDKKRSKRRKMKEGEEILIITELLSKKRVQADCKVSLSYDCEHTDLFPLSILQVLDWVWVLAEQELNIKSIGSVNTLVSN